MKTIQRIVIALVAILLAGGLFAAPAQADEPTPTDPLEQCQADLSASTESREWWIAKQAEWQMEAGDLRAQLAQSQAILEGTRATLDVANETTRTQARTIGQQAVKIDRQAETIARLRARLAARH